MNLTIELLQIANENCHSPLFMMVHLEHTVIFLALVFSNKYY